MIANPSNSPSFNVDNVTPLPQGGASVPISVYKQLAKELKETQAEIASLQTENRQLRAHNRTLHQQVHQVVQSTERLKQMVSRHDFGIQPLPPATAAHRQPKAKSPTPQLTVVPMPPEAQRFTTLQPEIFASETELDPGINAWVLLVAAIAIIFTSFGAGYMVVLPLLNNHNGPSR
ncbi:hypothetical protein NIES970_21370 [[Synechococcus] sp. NIES-970]|nr:hypothetical protein NIES970_21370 [[Synechococcus] sp. NIES-970]